MSEEDKPSEPASEEKLQIGVAFTEAYKAELAQPTPTSEPAREAEISEAAWKAADAEIQDFMCTATHHEINQRGKHVQAAITAALSAKEREVEGLREENKRAFESSFVACDKLDQLRADLAAERAKREAAEKNFTGVVAVHDAAITAANDLRQKLAEYKEQTGCPLCRRTEEQLAAVTRERDEHWKSIVLLQSQKWDVISGREHAELRDQLATLQAENTGLKSALSEERAQFRKFRGAYLDSAKKPGFGPGSLRKASDEALVYFNTHPDADSPAPATGEAQP